VLFTRLSPSDAGQHGLVAWPASPSCHQPRAGDSADSGLHQHHRCAAGAGFARCIRGTKPAVPGCGRLGRAVRLVTAGRPALQRGCGSRRCSRSRTCQGSQVPPRLERGGHHRGKPAPLCARQRPAWPEPGEELTGATCRRRTIEAVTAGVARARVGGGWFPGWFKDGSGATAAPVRALVAPPLLRSLHPVGPTRCKDRTRLSRYPQASRRRGAAVAPRRRGCPAACRLRSAGSRRGRSGPGTGARGPPGPRRPDRPGRGA